VGGDDLHVMCNIVVSYPHHQKDTNMTVGRYTENCNMKHWRIVERHTCNLTAIAKQTKLHIYTANERRRRLTCCFLGSVSIVGERGIEKARYIIGLVCRSNATTHISPFAVAITIAIYRPSPIDNNEFAILPMFIR
jgi:hypothetical protein